jgi:hypothetical protein
MRTKPDYHIALLLSGPTLVNTCMYMLAHKNTYAYRSTYMLTHIQGNTLPYESTHKHAETQAFTQNLTHTNTTQNTETHIHT